MKTLLVSTAIVLAAAGQARADIIYAPTPISPSPRTSDYGGGSGFRTFDDFSVSGDAQVHTISLRGLWADFSSPAPALAPSPDVLTWEIAFYADNGGTPGSELSLQTFAAADVTSTFLSTGVLSAGGTFNVSHYLYSVDLPNPVALNGGNDYWVSVFSRSAAFNPAFALLGATGGNDGSYQQTLGPAMSILSATPVARDRAIVLEGTVPEPPAVILALVATVLLPFSGLLAQRRRATRASGNR